MAVDQNSFIREGPFFANKTFLSRIFRKLYVYLSRNPCWATTPLMKVHSSPASRNPLHRTSCYWLGIFLAWLTGPLPSKCTRIRGTANTRGLGVCLSQSLTFGSLAAAFGACFLRLQKSNVRQYQRQVQGCASRPWYLAVRKPHLRKFGCYLWRER